MFGSKFSPRLESLDSRLCLSTTGGEVMAVDMFRPGEEVAAVDYYRTAEERGAAVDYFLVNNEKGATVDRDLLPAVKVESGWDVKPGEERGAFDAFRTDEAMGIIVEYKVAASGWDVKPGEERRAAVDYFRTGGERSAAVDYFYPTDQIGGPHIGESGWDKQS
jgi:hypothetical protein